MCIGLSRLKDDLKACSNERKSAFKNIIFNTNFHCVVMYRVAHAFYKIKLTFISQIIKFLMKVIYCVDIDFRADLAGGFVIIHGIGVVIGAAVKSHGPLKVYQGVTLGGNNNKTRIVNGDEFVQPIIGKNVIIYANSCVFGPVVIGDNCTIGASTVITKDVENNKIVFKKQELNYK
ncbi:serine O-acetyltransferase [uncultured Clostridium sp.]|uniref:serine O-acetyltransferase n=1 Tax=uncultured Clostridium sp. TaxID=59620 RepID=UPI002599C6BE|nr:DapH/DapD/GlmU-related protein [uncultured Clostridium sp.]